jgi:putative sterol carrier protein
MDTTGLTIDEIIRRRDAEVKENHRKSIRNWQKKNPEKQKAYVKKYQKENLEQIKDYNHKRKYGITIEERNSILIKQGGCACCEAAKPGSKYGWQMDHDHVTGIIRGILCHHCNVALGQVKDSIEHLKKLIIYLEKHSTGEQHASRDPYP